MADERRMLSALERRRLHNASPLDSRYMNDGQEKADSAGLGSRAPWRAVEATPPRRKSSMLTLSHLTPATPPVQVASGGRKPSKLVSDAVRDIARELEAVEARLSVFRERRETANAVMEEEEDNSTPAQETEKDRLPVAEKEKELTEAPASGETQQSSKPTQQAGEVADEVEHALANCDRLLHQAKLQASAASLTRSLRSSGGSRTPHPSSMNNITTTSSSLTTVRQPFTTNDGKVNDPSSSFSVDAAASLSAGDELELAATACAMKALVSSHSREMEQTEEAVREQNQRTQAAQLKEMERKFESKKKMLVLTVREQCEAETRAVIKQAIAYHEQAQKETLEKIEQQMLADREHMLSAILARHQTDTEDHIQRVQVRVKAETLQQKQTLEKQLQQALEDAIHDLEQDTAVELKRWEQKQRLNMETGLLTRREQAATTILQAQEAKTNELKLQLQEHHVAKEATELDKLKKALAFGAQAQLQQLRKQLEAAHEQTMSDTRTEAAQKLETKLTDLKQVLTLAHEQEREQTQRELEKRHRVAVMETHEQLEMLHRTEIAELTNKAATELETTVATLRKELDQQNKLKLDALQQTFKRDHRVRMHQVELENDRECEDGLKKLREQVTESNQRELDAKLSRMQQSKTVLMDEAVHFLSIKPDERAAASGRTNTTEALLQLKQLGGQLPKELQRAVMALVRDFEELCEEQRILVEKISDSTGMYLTFKRQCGQLETDVHELRMALQTMHSQLQAKDALAKKLYLANEALLKKLGLGDPLR